MKKMISGLLVCGLFSLVLLQLSGKKEDTEQKAVDPLDIYRVDAKDIKLEIVLLVEKETTSLRYTLSNNYCQRAFSLGDSVDEEDFQDWRYELPDQAREIAEDANLSSNAIIFTIPEEKEK